MPWAGGLAPLAAVLEVSMFLRAKDGAHKGEIREFPPEVGRSLLAAGRVENPFAEPVAPANVAAKTITSAATKAAKPNRSRN